MKKTVISLITAAAFGIVLLISCATSNESVTTRKSAGARVHTYSAGGANAVIVENTALVVFDSFGGSAEDGNLRTYISLLNKPVERVFISHGDDHHWIGIDTLFPGTEIFSTDAAVIKQHPKGTAIPVKLLADGTVSFDGVTYEFISYRDLGAYVIKMPAQKTAMVHHLGYPEFHVPLPPLDIRLDILRDLRNEGYTWFIGGHGTPMEAGKFIAQVEDYNAFVSNAVTLYKTPEEARDVIAARYPQWGGDYLLNIFLPLFYNK